MPEKAGDLQFWDASGSHLGRDRMAHAVRHHLRPQPGAPASPWARKWWFADTQAIEREDWNLSASRHRPESRAAAEHRDPRELLPELRGDAAATEKMAAALAAELFDARPAGGSGTATAPSLAAN